MPSRKLTYKDSNKGTMFCPAFIDDYGFSPEEFRVFSRIMRRCLSENSKGFFEGVPTIAKQLQISERLVRRALRVLVGCKAITCEERLGETSLYDFNTSDKWEPSEKLPQIRKIANQAKYRPTPLSKTQGVTPVENARGGLSKTQGAPLSKTPDKGTPSEGTPIKGTQEECVPDENKFIPREPYRKLRNVTNIAEYRPGPDFDDFRDELEEWWCKLHGIVSLPPNADTAEQVTWLFANEFSLDDVKGFYRFATTDPEEKRWRRGQLTLGAIVKGIAGWKVKAKAEEQAQYVPKFCDACRDEDGFIPKIVDGVRRMARCKHDQVKVAA
jgi:hypothetical protein